MLFGLVIFALLASVWVDLTALYLKKSGRLQLPVLHAPPLAGLFFVPMIFMEAILIDNYSSQRN